MSVSSLDKLHCNCKLSNNIRNIIIYEWQHIRWYKQERMGTIQEEDFSDMAENRYWTEGRDKEGRPSKPSLFYVTTIKANTNSILF